MDEPAEERFLFFLWGPHVAAAVGVGATASLKVLAGDAACLQDLADLVVRALRLTR